MYIKKVSIVSSATWDALGTTRRLAPDKCQRVLCCTLGLLRRCRQSMEHVAFKLNQKTLPIRHIP